MQAEIKDNHYFISKWAIISVLGFTAIIYIRALFNGFADFDDGDYVLQNPYIKEFNLQNIKNIFTTFYFANYHPFTMFIYLLEYTCFGSNPFPYHLLNVVLHITNTYLVFKLTEQLSGNKLTAFIVSLLFGIHPMHVESVAWVSELKDMLYSFFYLFSLIIYIRFIKSGYKRKYYITALLLFIMSLFSKSAAVTLSVLLLVIDLYLGRKLNIKLLLEKIPFLLLSLLFGILAMISQQSVGAINELSVFYNFFERIFLVPYSIAFYIVKLIAPFNLAAMHYYPETFKETLNWEYYASLPFLMLVFWLLFKCKMFRKEILFGISFFFIAISVMLQFISVGSAIASERYTYISYIGLFYIAGQYVSNISYKKLSRFVCCIFFIVVLFFSYLTWERIAVWENGKVLFTDVIKKNPENMHGYWLRGNIRKDEGDIKGALSDYNVILKHKPNFILCYIYRGDMLYKLGRYSESLNDFNQAINRDKNSAIAYFSRGKAYDILGDTISAMNDYDKAISLNPKMNEAYNNRGILRAKKGYIKGAMEDMDKAIKILPNNVEAYNNRGNIKTLIKDYKGAVQDFDYSLKINPNDKQVYYNRGISKLYLNDISGACDDWQKAMSLGYDVSLMVKQYCH